MRKCTLSFTEPSYKIVFGTLPIYKFKNTHIFGAVLKYVIKYSL